jgi:hypothetical protein
MKVVAAEDLVTLEEMLKKVLSIGPNEAQNA